MIYLLDYQRISQDIIDSCGSIGIANVLSITKSILNLIQIIGPILAVVALAINFTKLTANPEEKKYKAGLKNSIIALVVLFMVPFLVNLSMSLADESFSIATCWNNAEDVAKIGEDNDYVEITDKDRQEIITKPNDYPDFK